LKHCSAPWTPLRFNQGEAVACDVSRHTLQQPLKHAPQSDFAQQMPMVGWIRWRVALLMAPAH
jgi:hypothetical protein